MENVNAEGTGDPMPPIKLHDNDRNRAIWLYAIMDRVRQSLIENRTYAKGYYSRKWYTHFKAMVQEWSHKPWLEV